MAERGDAPAAAAGKAMTSQTPDSVGNGMAGSRQPDDLSAFMDFCAVYSSRKSRVWRCIQTETGQMVAIKAYFRSELSSTDIVKVDREMRLLALLKHPNIIKCITTFSDRHALFIVQEYASRGDLCDVATCFTLRRLPDRSAAEKVALPLTQACNFIHSMGIIHRDIKPENIVVMRDGTLKLCDFGLSSCAAEDVPVSRVGTLEFMAPEVVALPARTKNAVAILRNLRQAQYDYKVDIWAIGCVAYEMLLGVCLFTSPTVPIDAAYVDQCIATADPPCRVSPEALAFIHSALSVDPRMRPSTDELLQSAWLNKSASPKPAEPARPPAAQAEVDRLSSALSVTTMEDDGPVRTSTMSEGGAADGQGR